MSEPTRLGPLRAIAFDLFHTLVDPTEFSPGGFRRTRAIAELTGAPFPELDSAWRAGEAARQLSVAPTALERMQAACRKLGAAPPAHVWPEVDHLLGAYQDEAILKPHAATVTALRVLAARGWRLGLLSNCDERERRSWGQSELSPLFDAAVFSCDIGFAKPSPEAYADLVPRWGGIPLREAVFVGDGMHDELPGARRAGFAKVVFQAGFVRVNGLRTAAEIEALGAEADVTVGSVEELEQILSAPPD